MDKQRMVYVCVVDFFDQTYVRAVFEKEEDALEWCKGFDRYAEENGYPPYLGASYMGVPLNVAMPFDLREEDV